MELGKLKKSDWWRGLAIVVLAFLYLSPGGGLLLEGRTDRVMSDGTDPATLPYTYGIVRDHLREAPTNLLFGAVPTDQLNPPEGFSLWLPWMERVAVVLGAPFFKLEQLSTFHVLLLLILSGLSFYFLGRVMGWSQTLSLALAICFAFNAYTRARAKVHMSLAGVYHLPLLFIGLWLVLRATSWRSLAVATVCWLVAATTAHYYLVITAFLVPFVVAFLILDPATRLAPRRVLGRTLVAALPALLLLAWSFLKPIPASFMKPETITYVRTGESEAGQRHPFMTRFAAQPIDYFTGELATGPMDVNPLRGLLNREVLKGLGDSNPHERTNGIRWLVWLTFAAAIFALTSSKWRELWSREERRLVWLMVGLAGFCMLLSFSPDAFGPIPGPSAWLHGLVSQFRVPSRAGIFAQFSILVVVGWFLHVWLERKRKKGEAALNLWPKLKGKLVIGGVLPLLALAEMPPLLNDMPVSPIQQQRRDLADGQSCGYGMYFPYVSGTWALLEYYYFLQSMRGSRCKILNAVADTMSDRNRRLMQSMPLHDRYLEFLRDNPEAAAGQLIKFARCLPLEWLVFDARVGKDFVSRVCQALGYTMTSADTCRNSVRGQALAQSVEACL